MNMLDDNEIRLQLVVDDTQAPTPLADIVRQYADEIDQRRRQLCDDLADYESKLEDLRQLDPLDFTGLAKIYRGHTSHIRKLLNAIDQS
jgi:hypothetical protein